MLPPALLTEENVIMLMHVNERHLAHQIHPTLYNMLVSKTIDLLDQEIFRLITLSDAACNVLFQCTLLKHNFPYYRFIDSAQILRMQQNHEVALPMITFCNNTAAATGGPWITSEIFNQLFSYDEQSLIEISQICYWLSFQNRDLITYEPVGRLMSAVPFSERGLSSLFWLIFEQSYNDIITLDNFDKLMIPRSTLPKLLYDLAEQDSSRTVLSQPVFDSFVAHHEHLVRLTPYLKILNEAKAGLITATTCAEILAQGNNAALWASERVRCNSPETWLPLLPAQPSSLCAEPDFLKKMLRIYRCSDIFERGGAQHLGHNVRTLVEEFINHPEHLVWANDLAQHFLAGCVNQPVRGFSEIAAWLVVAKQTTASRRFDALRYPTILELIQKRMFEENNLLGVEVEKANALLREACSGHPLCSDWLGIPGKLAYEETITGWLNTQQKLIFEIWDTVQHMSGAMIHDFLMHTDFMLTWAPIAFPSLLADIDAQENARKEQLLELIEQACCSTLSSITPEHYSLLWPDKTATDCARLMDSFSESQTSIIDIVQSAYSSFERRLDTQKYNAVIEQTQELCDAYDENMEQRRVSHQLMMLELRQHPSLLFDSPTQDGGSSPSSVVRPF